MGQTCCGTNLLEDNQQEVEAYANYERRDGKRIINQNRMNQQEGMQPYAAQEIFRDPTY